jgi:hypothetical protein
MMKKQTLFFVIYLLYINFELSLTVGIHILRAQHESKKEIEKKKLKHLRSNDSKFSKMCLNLLSTYSYMGEHSMDLYKTCNQNYAMFGATDELMIKDQPVCFSNLNQFFCNYKIKSQLEETEGKTGICGDEELIELVLSLIKGCIQVNYLTILPF